MPVFVISEKSVKAAVFIATGLFLCSVAMYFLHVPVPHKLCFPVGLLFLSSLCLTRWEISLALLFSALGDLAGSYGNFLLQMGSFAVAHIFYISFFLRRSLAKPEQNRKFSSKARAYMMMMGICVAILLLMIFIKVVPSVPEGILRVGVSIYSVLICTMLFSAMLQRSTLYALGALLFVISDFILAWNKFLEPVPCREFLVLGNYFMAQWLLFFRSTPFRAKLPIRLMRA